MSEIGSRSWISHNLKLLQEHPAYQNNSTLQTEALGTTLSFYKDLLIQGKKISQLICYIWSSDDTDTVEKLDEYFKGINRKDLKNLLFADGNEDEDSEAYPLLKKVFDQNNLPIFHKQDKECVVFEVSVDKFEGSLDDPHPGRDKVLLMTIPYPPRPKIEDDTKGYAPIKKSKIKEWLEDKDYEPNKTSKYFPPNPYLPSSTS